MANASLEPVADVFLTAFGPMHAAPICVRCTAFNSDWEAVFESLTGATKTEIRALVEITHIQMKYGQARDTLRCGRIHIWRRIIKTAFQPLVFPERK